MAVKRTSAEKRGIKKEIKRLDKQILRTLKKIQKISRDLKSKFGVFKYTGPILAAMFLLALVVDLILAIFGVLTLELLDFVDWIIEFGMFIFLGLMGLGMMLASRKAGKHIPLTIVLFFLSFIIEIVPGLSILPAIAGFALRIIYSLNRAKLEVKLDDLNKDKKKFEKQRGELKQMMSRKSSEGREIASPGQDEYNLAA